MAARVPPTASPPPLPQNMDLYDPDRKSRTHVVGLRTFDKEYLIELSDGSTVVWSMLPQLRGLLEATRRAPQV